MPEDTIPYLLRVLPIIKRVGAEKKMYMTTRARQRIDLYSITNCRFVTVTRGPKKTKLNERTNFFEHEQENNKL